jgi:RNA polymerase sigma factor (sigma-70 family)
MARMDESATVQTLDPPPGGPSGSSNALDFETFFVEQHDSLYRALWLAVRNRHEAEEITQDAFLRLWERWDRMADIDDPVAYLYRTAMNLFRSRLRRAKVAVRKAIGHLPPDDGLAEVEARDAVVKALSRLPRRQRAAIVLLDVLGLSSEQAAAILQSTPVTVRVQASRGRAVLRRELGERDD